MNFQLISTYFMIQIRVRSVFTLTATEIPVVDVVTFYVQKGLSFQLRHVRLTYSMPPDTILVGNPNLALCARAICTQPYMDRREILSLLQPMVNEFFPTSNQETKFLIHCCWEANPERLCGGS